MKVILDCDPANGLIAGDIDDGIALALLSRMTDVELLGVTTVDGNSPAPVGAGIAQRILHLAGIYGVPVVPGGGMTVGDGSEVREELERRQSHPLARKFWADGSNPNPVPVPCESPAPCWLVETVKAHPHAITLIAIGPLSNVAKACLIDPDFARNVKALVVMGGSFKGPTGVRELNFASDPEAAAVVFRAQFVRRLVPLDTTRKTMWQEYEVLALSGHGDPLLEFLVETSLPWVRYIAELRSTEGCHLHDPLAIAAAVGVPFISWQRANIGIHLSGHDERSRPYISSDRNGESMVAMDVGKADFNKWVSSTLMGGGS